ncbi:exported hypothetical protein [Candidatus Sulfopaludibacter sp. SbA3]|nr:exported hypothetical protein [Candidatus Sulfopaludibacter sp. SbA3]
MRRSRPTKRTARIVLLAALALLVSLPMYPAESYNLKFYGREKGLTNLAALCYWQDRSGYIWVGTTGGLFRYDGVSFHQYGSKEGLSETYIWSLTGTPDGALWVGTGAGIVRQSGGRFEPVELPVKLTGYPVFLSSDAQGDVYAATSAGLLVGMAGESPRRFRLPDDPLARRLSKSVFAAGPGRVWFSCDQELCLWDGARVTSYGAESGLPAEKWRTILEDRDGNLWLRSGEKVARRKQGESRFRVVAADLGEATAVPEALTLDPFGRVIAGSSHGILVWDASVWRLLEPSTLSGDAITFLTTDREGSLWVGLYGKGLAQWVGYGEWENWTTHEGLASGLVWRIRRDGAGTLWVGTNYGLQYREPKPPWSSRQFEAPSRAEWNSFEHRRIRSVQALAVDPNGDLWVGGRMPPCRIDHRSRVMQCFGPESGLPAGATNDMRSGRDGRLYLGSARGVFRSSPLVSGAPVRFEQVGGEVSGAGQSAAVLQDQSGAIWSAAYIRGVLVWQGDSWKRYTPADGLRKAVVVSVEQDREGWVWISYAERLPPTRARLHGGRLEIDTAGPAANARLRPYSMHDDGRGGLWSLGDAGVDVLRGAQWTHYDADDGLIFDDTNSGAFLADADGSYWIGTSNGLSHFTPHRPVAAPDEDWRH